MRMGPPRTAGYPARNRFRGRLTLKGELSDTTTLKVKGTYTDFEYNSVNLSELYDCPTVGWHAAQQRNPTPTTRGFRQQ